MNACVVAAESTTSGGLIVLRLTPLSSGQEDRQLDVCWLELLPKIIVDSAERAIDLSSCGTSTMHGFGTPRHKACCPFRNERCGRTPHFLGASDEQTQTGDGAEARPESENDRAGPTEQAEHC
jgi:hypothetical protein